MLGIVKEVVNLSIVRGRGESALIKPPGRFCVKLMEIVTAIQIRKGSTGTYEKWFVIPDVGNRYYYIRSALALTSNTSGLTVSLHPVSCVVMES